MNLFRITTLAGLLFTQATIHAAEPAHEVRNVVGWSVHIHPELLGKQAEATTKALELLQKQLEEIVQKVPEPAVKKLKEVPLWFMPEYKGLGPRAEYHPGEAWLKDNGRNPAMVKGIEFTNIRVFEQEIKRMPNFALHELAHAYHDRVLGFFQGDIKAAYDKAKAAKSYDSVDRWNGEGKPYKRDKAYAMVDHKEYFAETTEAFFSRNDFFPFDRKQLKEHDPEMERVLERVWTEGK